MKVAIDGRAVTIKNDAGLITYIYNLIKHLNLIAPYNSYFCYIDKRDKLLKNFNLRKAWAGLENHIIGDLWEQIWLPIDLKIKKIDVYHGTGGRLPFIRGAKYVLTIHDMIAFRHPEFANRKFVIYTQKLIKSGIRWADKVIAVSYNTKKDIMEILGVPEERIEVIYEGVDEIFKPMNKEYAYAIIKNKYNLCEKFILCVSNLEVRKNLKRLLIAYKELKKEGLKHHLLIVGPPGWMANNILDEIKEIPGIVLTGYVDFSLLPILYNAADAFIFISLYEGFGLPPLEAMACGIPVVASNTSSLPEILGDASITTDPLNIQQIKENIKKALFDKKLREEKISKGFKRVTLFSWKKMAYQTLKVYRNV